MGNLYEIFWFYTQFYLKPEDRRPYTYIFRDWYHHAPLPTIVGLAIVFYMIGRYTTQISILTLISIIVALLVGIVGGHLWWGKGYIPNQQETPQYLGKDEKQ